MFIERLTEPLHLNILSAFVMVFGSTRAKIDWDLVVRQQYAFSILMAADRAREAGNSGVTVVEMGVAAGAGLLNMCKIADRVSAATGVDIRVVGFDTGKGMPPAVDYRDHPEAFQHGDFPMEVERLRAALPERAELVIGDVGETIPGYVQRASQDYPIGFVSIDVDYYSSAKQALRIFDGPPQIYLPRVAVYLDDIMGEYSSPFAGELLAVEEFNRENQVRKIAKYPMLTSRRIFKNARWIEQIYVAQIHDHPLRSPERTRAHQGVIKNEYL